MVNIYIMPNGNLSVHLQGDDEKDTLRTELVKRGVWIALNYALKEHSERNRYIPVNALNKRPFIGTSKVYCIVESLDTMEDDVYISGRIWHYTKENSCPIRDLLRTGSTEFAKL